MQNAISVYICVSFNRKGCNKMFDKKCSAKQEVGDGSQC